MNREKTGLTTAFGFVAGLVFPVLSPASEPGPVSTQTAALMAQNCFACHGPAGRSPGNMPSLHHLTAEGMAAMLKAFKSGERPSTVMGRHAKAYSDAEIEALAAYIAGLQKK